MPYTSGGGETPKRGVARLLERGLLPAPPRRPMAIVASAAALALVLALVPDPGTGVRAPGPVSANGLVGTSTTLPEEAEPLSRLAAPLPGEGGPQGPVVMAAPPPPSDLERSLTAPAGGAPPAPRVDPLQPPPIVGGGAFEGKVVDLWRLDPNVSWYGPGFYGRRTACGYAMTESLVGVAHRTLPCGTLVQFRNGGRVVSARVVDRGPYVAGRQWDLTAGLCRALAHCYTGALEYRIP